MEVLVAGRWVYCVVAYFMQNELSTRMLVWFSVFSCLSEKWRLALLC